MSRISRKGLTAIAGARTSASPPFPGDKAFPPTEDGLEEVMSESCWSVYIIVAVELFKFLQVLALLRGAVLRLHDNEAFASLNASFHHHSAKPHAALSLLKTPLPQIN